MADVKWLTFDAYGTLVDFDISGAIVEALGDRKERIDLEEFLRVCERDRYEEVLGSYRPYREILRTSLRKSMETFGLEYRDADGDHLIARVPTFGPFPDAPPVLERLRQHFKLVIISNTEDDLIAGNLERLGVPIDVVITAEQAQGYKPSLDVFRYTFDRLGADPSEIVHIAQGFDYDIVPASQLGLRRIWINRRGRAGDPAYGPYDEVPDLTGVPGLLDIE